MNSSEESVSVTGEAGFSILEVVIALVILMTLLVATSTMLVTSFKIGANSRFRQAATEIATSNLDYQVQVGANTLVGEVGDTALPTVTSNGQTYVPEMEVSPYTSSNASSCANPNGGLAMLKITVWVTWANVSSSTNWWVSGATGSTGLLVSETTLLALPSTAFNAKDGSILVDITGVGGSSDGIEGVSVTATYGSTTYTAVTTGSGCALFANLTPALWTISASESGYIDDLDDWTTSPNGATPLSGTSQVLASNVGTLDFTYDQEATVTPSYSVTLAGATPWLPTGINSVPLTFYTSYGTAFPSTGVVMASPASVFPANTSPSYDVVAGSCGAESSPAGASLSGAASDGRPVTVTPGGTAAPTFALTPLDIVVSHSGTAVSNASISAAVSSSDANCPTGTLAMPTLGLGASCVPGGPVTTPPSSCSSLAADRHEDHPRHPTHAFFVGTCSSNCSTSTSVTTGTNPTIYGSTTTLLTATVACSSCTTGLGQPTGTVDFYHGTTLLGSGSLSGGSSDKATYTTTITNLPAGADSITADYVVTPSKWAASNSSAITQNVDAPTTTTLTASPSPNAYGTSTVLTAAVAASGTTSDPTGTVNFEKNGVSISGCSSQTVNSGSATCTVAGLVGGSYTLLAVYSPTSFYLTSTSSPWTQNVSAATTTTVVTSSSFLDASTFGTSVTFTATVTAASGGPATGAVAFTSNGTAISGCTAVSLSVAGVATCTTSTLASGNDAISAVYTATTPANFATSTGVMTQLVYLEGTTPSIETGLPYGSWILTVSYAPPVGAPGYGTTYTATYTLLINLSGVYVNGVKATTFPIQLSD